MLNNFAALPLILLGVFLNACAQLLLKQGMVRMGDLHLSWSTLMPLSQQALLNPFILIAISCYALSILVWMVVLSRAEVSYAYPMLSIGYIVVAIAGYYLFQENLSLTRILGILVIIVGVYLLNKR